ncbi:MAG: hypothetical protein ACT6RL_00365 [Neoaquamicrobium sediminum]|uniref:hypothetical protein n=1 Tax=Neoaquamicrobium sediminum TaxID=1849104 RepID=UPI0040364BF9
MNAAKTVRLSDFASEIGYETVRDASFRHVAKIATRLDSMVVPLTDAAFADALGQSDRFTGVITSKAFADLVPPNLGLALSDTPGEAHAALHARICAIPGLLWESFETEIGPGCSIAETAIIPPRDVRIGAGCVIAHGAVIHPRSVIGENVGVRERCVVGSAAYEIIKIGGRQVLRPQAGGVKLGDGVELLPGVSISRTAFGGFTSIGEATVIDHNVVVSHDTEVGENTRVGGQGWIGGRVRIGNDVVIGPQVTITNGLTLGDRCHVSLGSVVTHDVPSGQRVSGNFAIAHDRFIEALRKKR